MILIGPAQIPGRRAEAGTALIIRLTQSMMTHTRRSNFAGYKAPGDYVSKDTKLLDNTNKKSTLLLPAPHRPGRQPADESAWVVLQLIEHCYHVGVGVEAKNNNRQSIERFDIPVEKGNRSPGVWSRGNSLQE